MTGGSAQASPVEGQAREAVPAAAPASSAPPAVHAPAASLSSWAPKGRLPYFDVGLNADGQMAATIIFELAEDARAFAVFALAHQERR